MEKCNQHIHLISFNTLYKWKILITTINREGNHPIGLGTAQKQKSIENSFSQNIFNVVHAFQEGTINIQCVCYEY